jgi:hypothetical protein
MKRNPAEYHKVWREHHGEIPRDDKGRRLEIHHIDGNKENNDISNLSLVTIEEHYRIHEVQGDVGACLAILMRMNSTPEERSNMAKLAHQKNPEIARKGGLASYKSQKEKGSHIFHQPGQQRELAKVRIEKGTHPFQRRPDGTSLAMDQVKNGTNTFASERNPNNTMVSCVNCKKEVSLPIFYRNHEHNCKGADPKYYDPNNKIGCVACKKTVVLPAFKRNHLSGKCQFDKKDK